MKIYILAAFFAVASAAKGNKEYTTPVPILKQIDKHNEDGSYSYGYEAADGTFKIETKYPNGEVYGKYGYVDDTGNLREVEYGASRRGFEPAGNDITVAPPTLNNNRDAVRPLAPEEEDDGQYREDPADYYKDEPYAQPQPQQRPAPRYRPEAAYRRPEPVYRQPEPEYEPFEPEITRPSYRPQTSYRPQSYSKPPPAYKPQPSYRPQSYYNEEPQPVYKPQPAYRPQSNFGFQNNNNNNNWNANPAPTWNNDPLWNSNPGWNNARPNGPAWNGHPAQNVDIWTGSYSVNYKR